MKLYAIAYAATAAVFLALDLLWLGVVARDFYRGQLGGLMTPEPVVSAAVAFYLLYVAGVVFFAVAPALAANSWTTALASGLFLGLIAYGTYDFTNLATLRDWPVAMSFVDLAWGSVVTGVSATSGFLITRAIVGGG